MDFILFQTRLEALIIFLFIRKQLNLRKNYTRKYWGLGVEKCFYNV